MKSTEYCRSRMSKAELEQFELEKTAWISKYGSANLHTLIAAGYAGNDLYIAERLAADFPGFELASSLSIVKADSPSSFYLEACHDFPNSYCSTYEYISDAAYYVTLDDFLGSIKIAKKIDPPPSVNSSIALTKPDRRDIPLSGGALDSYEAEKRGWISQYGSDLLNQAIINGYSCEELYVNERAHCEHPGFKFASERLERVDSPNLYLLQQCDSIPGTFCSSLLFDKSEYYLTIENYLGKHTIVREISDCPKKATALAKSRSTEYQPIKSMIFVFSVMMIPASIVISTILITNYNSPPHKYPPIVLPEQEAVVNRAGQ